MNYLLDTNAVIAFINGKPAAVRGTLVRTVSAGHAIRLSSIVLQELWYGAEKSVQSVKNARNLENFLAEGFEIFSFDDEDARVAGALRGELAKAGTPIGPYDILIAAQAVRRNATLVTANEKEFARIKGLKWENWLK